MKNNKEDIDNYYKANYKLGKQSFFHINIPFNKKPTIPLIRADTTKSHLLLGVSSTVLTKSVYELATSVKAMQKDLTEITERIRTVEETPKRRWDLVVSALISGIVGFLLKGMFM